jgi:hypothetical protein
LFCLLAKFWSVGKNKAIEREEERMGEVTTWRFATEVLATAVGVVSEIGRAAVWRNAWMLLSIEP